MDRVILPPGTACLTRDELVFNPGLGYQRVVEYEGDRTAVEYEQGRLANEGWTTRISYSGDGVHLEATAPDLSTDGDTITGAEDQWEFSTEVYDASIWASPMLFNWVKAALSLTDTATRDKLIVWKAAVDQNLKVKYGTLGEVLTDVDGSKLSGPTPLVHFHPLDENKAVISGDEYVRLGELYEWIVAGQTSVLTSLVSIQRRRQVPVKSTRRFHTLELQNVWLPNFFKTDFLVPAHVAALLPPVPTILPFRTAVWGYRLRKHDASATTSSTRITEILDWSFGAWNRITHTILGTS
jgi:hypothetical protein